MIPWTPRWPQSISLHQDLHIHSTFSDGQASVEAIERQARQRGLEEIAFVDHVRRDTD